MRYWEEESDVSHWEVLRPPGLPHVYGTDHPKSIGGHVYGSGYVNQGPSALGVGSLPLASEPAWNHMWYVDRYMIVFELPRIVVEGEMGLIHDGRCRIFIPLHDAYVPVLDQIMPIALPTRHLKSVISFPQASKPLAHLISSS